MYLKRLTLQGFKSFCDRTTIEFAGRLTAIVGPNGCGKSNLVDALKWAFGEQSAKDLRGQEMKDVIFTGTDTRRPVSFAEVIVEFDNADGLLPVEAAEVAVARRLFRSGESEYRLNGSKCRLRDIREILAGTGIGTESYSILEQGKIDLLLQASPKERRVIFEEAAGISKYRMRRDEALRQLLRTEDNLARLNDLLSEIEKRIRSVRIQAGRARRYRELLAELRSCRLQAAWHDLMRFYRERSEWTFRLSLARKELEALESERQEKENEARRYRELRAEADQTLGSLGAKLEGIRNQQSRIRETIAVTEKRLTELAQAAEHRREEARRACHAIEAFKEELEGLGAERARTEERIEELDRSAAQVKEQATELRESMRQEDSALSVLRNKLVGLLQRETEIRNSIASKEREAQLLKAELGRLQREHAALSRALCLSEAEEKRSREIRAVLETEKTRLARQREAVAEALAEETAQLEESERKWAEARGRLQALESRKELLERLLADLEGVGKSTRRAIQAAREGRVENVRGLLAELLTVEPRYAKAVEAALGPWAQAVVVEAFEDLEALREFLGAEAALAAVVLAAPVGSRLKPVAALTDPSSGSRILPIPQEAAEVAAGPCTTGCLGAESTEEARQGARETSASGVSDLRTPGPPAGSVPALTTFSCEPELRPMLEALLGRTAVVEEERWRELVRAGSSFWRVVSTSGAVLEPWGGVRLGTPAGVLVRRTELLRCKEEIQVLRVEEERLGREVGARKNHINKLNERIRAIASCEAELLGRIQASCEGIRHVATRRADFALQVDVLKREQSTKQYNLKDLQEAALSLRASLCAVRQEREQVEAKVRGAEEKLNSIRRKLSETERALSDLRVTQASAREKVRRLEEAESRVESLLNERKAQLERAQAEERNAARSHQEAEEELRRLRETLIRKQEEEKELGARLEEARRRLTDLLNAANRAEEAFGEVERKLEELRSDISDMEIEQREVAIKAEGVIEGIKEEYGIDLGAVARGEEKSEEIENLGRTPPEEGLREQIHELKEKISRCGNVNLQAIEELKELEERFEYLAAQRDDLVKAKTRLTNVINDLNRRSRRLFAETFQAVNAAFGELFRKTFGGGKAELQLEEGEDILTAGVEIIARPPGKKPSSIRQLSGGERTLAAIALLFAVLKVRPTPFVVLDEVDAALDEANIQRFLILLDQFTDKTQFLLITHNKLTMSKSDSLIGITMEEKGVSKRISLSLAQIDEGLKEVGVDEAA